MASATQGNITVCQINLNNCRAATHLLVEFATNGKIDIILTQDIYLRNEVPIGLPQSWTYLPSRRGSSAVVITRRSLVHLIRRVTENAVVIEIEGPDGKFEIGSVYSSPSSDLLEDIQNLELDPGDNNIILSGDLNAKNRSWGYSRNDGRGEIILDFCTIYGLNAVNNLSQPPTYHLQGRYGCPDLTIASTHLVEKISDWTVHLTESGSDHRYITYTIAIPTFDRINNRYKTKYGNDLTFVKRLKVLEHNLIADLELRSDVRGIDEHLELFYDNIYKVCDKTFRTCKRTHRKKITWWTQTLKTKRNRLTALYKRQKASGRVEDRMRYNRERSSYKKEINRVKTQSWINFCKSTRENYGEAFRVFKGRGQAGSRDINTVFEGMPDGTDLDGIYKKLIDTHFSLTSAGDAETPTPSVYEEITLQEMRTAIDSQALDKAPGPDRIDVRILKGLATAVPSYLIRLFNLLISMSYFPEAWKVAEVIFFLKPNKKSDSPKSYRPVCLLQNISKVLEKIINNRLNYVLENNNILHPNQFGFREGKNTEQCLNFLLKTVDSYRTNYKYIAIVSFDYTGAFDRADWSLIKDAIKSYEIDEYLSNIIGSYLRNRKIQYQVKQRFSTFCVSRGCPQGSCLGPTLWNILANSVLNDFKEETTSTIVAYADDMAIVVPANSRRQLESEVNRLIERFSRISDDNNLEISVEKTKAIVLGKDTSRRNPIFKLNGTNISVVRSLKYLGVVLDSRLTFLPHLEALKESVWKMNINMGRLTSKYGGVSPRLLRLWYMTVVQPKLLYAVGAWYPRMNCHGRSRLISIQRPFLIKLTRSYRSASNDALSVLAGIPPITIVAEELSRKFNLKYNDHSLFIRNQYLNIRDFESKTLKTSKSPNDYPSNLFLGEKGERGGISGNVISFYTDGSKTNAGVALGIFSVDNGDHMETRMERMKPGNSVFQAEATAILVCLQDPAILRYDTVCVYTDSLSTVMALGNTYPKSPIVNSILHQVKALKKPVHISWVKAHNGNLGNEMADLLARMATGMDIGSINTPLPFSHFTNLSRETVLREWQRQWDNSEKGRSTYDVLPVVKMGMQIRNHVLIYFITGKGSFPTFLRKINKLDTSLCVCGEEGSPLHFLQTSCRLSPECIRPRGNEDLHQYFKRLDRGGYYIDTVNKIYNTLNRNYSFIVTLL